MSSTTNLNMVQLRGAAAPAEKAERGAGPSTPRRGGRQDTATLKSGSCLSTAIFPVLQHNVPNKLWVKHLPLVHFSYTWFQASGVGQLAEMMGKVKQSASTHFFAFGFT